jgi:UDP-GlcNAc:undecaprenyl-phosphate GlcNAc-1-phosphate transferase
MSDRILTCLAVILTGYILSTLLVFPVRRAAIYFGILDFPGTRKCHTTPVPRIGGIAIFGAMSIVVWGSLLGFRYANFGWLSSTFHQSILALSQYPVILKKLTAIFLGASVITFVGLLDDIRGVNFPPLVKLLTQVFSALILLPVGITLDLFEFSPPIAMILSVAWIVGISNSFNLLDNMNGLSSGIAIICSAVFLALVTLKGEFFIALLLSALIGSIMGFFQFNIRKGSIFMGDTGSLFLGYMLGAISLMARYVDPSDASIFPVLAPIIILGLPLFDTVSVIVIRLWERRPIYVGDQMHLSHRLVRMGMSKKQAVLFNYLMAFTISINALLMINSRIVHSVIAVFEVGALAAMVSILMSTRPNPAPQISETPDALR